MSDLASRTTCATKRAVMGIEEDDNGFLAYRVLARRAESGADLRATTLLNHILQFDFRGRDFRDRLVQWEAPVRKYERQRPRNVLALPW